MSIQMDVLTDASTCVCGTKEEKLLTLEASGIAAKTRHAVPSRKYDARKLEALGFMPAEAAKMNYKHLPGSQDGRRCDSVKRSR